MNKPALINLPWDSRNSSWLTFLLPTCVLLYSLPSVLSTLVSYFSLLALRLVSFEFSHSDFTLLPSYEHCCLYDTSLPTRKKANSLLPQQTQSKWNNTNESIWHNKEERFSVNFPSLLAISFNFRKSYPYKVGIVGFVHENSQNSKRSWILLLPQY